MTVQKIAEHWYDGSFITFRWNGASDSGKTDVWSVLTKASSQSEGFEGLLLGKIKWFGRWRKYAFFPESGTLYEGTCMTEIVEFLKVVTNEHRTQNRRSLDASVDTVRNTHREHHQER